MIFSFHFSVLPAKFCYERIIKFARNANVTPANAGVSFIIIINKLGDTRIREYDSKVGKKCILQKSSTRSKKESFSWISALQLFFQFTKLHKKLA